MSGEKIGWLVVYEDPHASGGTFAYFFRDREGAEAVREFVAQTRSPNNFLNPRVAEVETFAPIALRQESYALMDAHQCERIYLASRLRAEFPTEFLEAHPQLTQLLIDTANELESKR